MGGWGSQASRHGAGAPVDPRSCEEAKASRLEVPGLPSQPFLGSIGSGEYRLGTDDQEGAFCLVLGNWATLSPALHLSGFLCRSQQSRYKAPCEGPRAVDGKLHLCSHTKVWCFSSHLCCLRPSLDLPEARSFLEGSRLKQSTVANSSSAKFLD